MEKIPPKLNTIIQDFAACVGQEKLEYLLDFAEQFPELPTWLHGKRKEMDEVPECMTPVFIHTVCELGRLTYYFDVPPESPTVRGFASLLSEGVNGSSPLEVLAIPTDFYRQMGLQQVLSIQRLNGLSAILAHMKLEATSNLGAS